MDFIKYPKICHLPGSKMSREDKRLGEVELAALVGPVHISEKVDGAVVCIGMKNNIPQLFKRSGPVRMGEHVQFKEFKLWVYSNMGRILLIPDSWRIYGEWLSIQHTVVYDELPDFFLAYDILTPDGFLSKYTSEKLFLRWGFSIPVAYDIQLSEIEKFASTTLSAYSTTDIMEGVVVRNDGIVPLAPERIVRGKWVRENFIQGEHWSKGQPISNQLRR